MKDVYVLLSLAAVTALLLSGIFIMSNDTQSGYEKACQDAGYYEPVDISNNGWILCVSYDGETTKWVKRK